MIVINMRPAAGFVSFPALESGVDALIDTFSSLSGWHFV